MGVDASGATTPTTGSRDVYRVAFIRAKTPKLGSRAVGKSRIRPTGENGCHELSVSRKRRKAHRVDTIVYRMESTGAHTLMRCPSIDSEAA